MKIWFISAVLVALCTAAWMLPSRGQSTPEFDALMMRKLSSAQAVLQGLAMEDHELIGRESQTLQLLSQESDWNVLQTAEYDQLSDDFRKSASRLRVASQEQNLDAAGLAYIKLTISCIECHRHMRDVRHGSVHEP
jgi:hypothetical protein